MAEIAFGSRVRKSPFFDATIESGATTFTIYNHMYLPMSYGDPVGEYKRLTTAVALWDVSAQRQIEIVGSGATSVAQLISARRLTDMKPGRARYAPMCDHHGRLINDPLVLRLETDRWWFSTADHDMGHWVAAAADSINSDTQVFEPDVSPLALQGPRSFDVARELFGAELIDSLSFFGHQLVELNGIPIRLCRSGWSRQGGFEFFLTDGSRGVELWNTVMAAGEPYGIGSGTPNHAERIENGLLSFGSDTDSDTDPIEAGLGDFVDLNGDFDYIGKQALLARIANPAARRRLVNITLDGKMPAAENPWPVSIEGEPVGFCRTATFSPRLGRNIGLALIAMGAATPGTVLDVDAAGELLVATVMSTPFGVSLPATPEPQ